MMNKKHFFQPKKIYFFYVVPYSIVFQQPHTNKRACRFAVVEEMEGVTGRYFKRPPLPPMRLFFMQPHFSLNVGGGGDGDCDVVFIYSSLLVASS